MAERRKGAMKHFLGALLVVVLSVPSLAQRDKEYLSRPFFDTEQPGGISTFQEWLNTWSAYHLIGQSVNALTNSATNLVLDTVPTPALTTADSLLLEEELVSISAVTSGVVARVTVTDGGSDYTSAPTVAFSGGGGSGATGTATISGGAVTGVTITARGSSYETPPAVSFSGGDGSGAMASATVGLSITIVRPSSGNVAHAAGIQVRETTAGRYELDAVVHNHKNFLIGTMRKRR